MSANLARIPIFMRDQADIAARVLVDELGLDAERANEVGLRISREVCAEHAGELVYVPRGDDLNRAERDRELYAFYCKCGRDPNPVARKFGLSVKQVYERVRMFEDGRNAENQGALFTGASNEDSEP
jgi:Mor family transcriptional regulator